MTVDENYQRQIRAQIAQYAEVEDMHGLSHAAHWLNQRFLAPRIGAIFGSTDHIEIYARSLSDAARRTGIPEAVSLGSGYGALEISIVKLARKLELSPFRLTCLELSPILVRRIQASAKEEGVEDLINAQVSDLNEPLDFPTKVAAFMAHHALHHFVELELIFDEIDKYLHPEGAFVTMDMIGRNGHMRWPETLKVVRDIWPTLPDRLKWDHSFEKLDRWYENWDCSIEGFEGIRAQDILPELVKRFRFEKFYANYGLTDVFVDRRFGGNFRISDDRDSSFLTEIQRLEDALIRDGLIKPVQIVAVMRSAKTDSAFSDPNCFDSRTPESSLRPTDVSQVSLPDVISDYGFANPYEGYETTPALTLIALNENVRFGAAQKGNFVTRWGWCDPDEAHVWSSGLESALEFRTTGICHQISFRMQHHVPDLFPGQTIGVSVNGLHVLSIRSCDGDIYSADLPAPIQSNSDVLIEFSNSRPRRPDLDGGDEMRPLGFALGSFDYR